MPRKQFRNCVDRYRGNKKLAELVKNGKFREDLYYRIRVVHLELPSLKKRREDIPLLVDYLITKFNRLQGKDIAGASVQVMSRLMAYDFPGNVRELENIIEQALVLCRGGIIELHHLPAELRPETPSLGETLGATDLKSMEKYLITTILIRHNGNRKQAAKDLGINVAPPCTGKLKAWTLKCRIGTAVPTGPTTSMLREVHFENCPGYAENFFTPFFAC